MEAHFITAAGDGLAPAVLLTLGDRLKAQYLFQVPESFSRFVLEHRVRPGLGLRAVFCTDLLMATGLSGLIMRLRGEGHGHFELIGPLGTLTFASSLRHFVHWRHPAVLTTEVEPNNVAGRYNQDLYTDEHVLVAPIQRELPYNEGKDHLDDATGGIPPWLRALMPEAAAKSSEAATCQEGLAGSHSETETDSTSATSEINASSGCTSSESDDGHKQAVENFMHKNGGSIPPETILSRLAESDRMQSTSVRVVHGREYHSCGFPGMSLLARQAGHNGPVGQHSQGGGATLLGYVCLVRASNQLLLILNCATVELTRQLESHRIIAALRTVAPENMAGVVISAPYEVSTSDPCSRLIGVLPGPTFLMNHPGPNVPQSLGFLSSTRATAKLRMVSPRMFPLPAAMQWQRCGKDVENGAVIVTGLTHGVWKNGKPELRPVFKNSNAELDAEVENVENSILESNPSLVESLQCLSAETPELFQDPPFLEDFSTSRFQSSPYVGTTAKRPRGDWDKRQQGSNKCAALALKARLQMNGNDVAGAGGSLRRSSPGYTCSPSIMTTEAPPSCVPEVVFLGTGCAEPSKYRGASAIYVLTGSGFQNVLLDCGEGCWGQFVRHYGPLNASKALEALGCVWVSHRHADHMAGMLRLLVEVPAQRSTPLAVIGPRALGSWLSETLPVLGLAGRVKFVHCGEVWRDAGHWVHTHIRDACGLTYFQPVPVNHCSDAWGLVLRHKDGWSVVYSGDTEPCQALARAGTGATVLIHEATFEPALEREARRKRHSTTSEAAAVALQMGVHATVLTHFSQRYPKFPAGVHEAVVANGKQRIAIAFDGMRLPLSLLPALPAVTAAVEAVLAGSASTDV